ncbi:MAG TPA: cysteine dioxygenase family protein [Xanthomonadales bacterium]|nr:cysteine dioxygenase family protein [Xanthomonadales bacterium]
MTVETGTDASVGALDFEGKERLIARIDEAVSGDCPFEITTCLRKALVESIADKAIRLPDSVYQYVPDHYARRELYHCPKKGFSVIAMTWGPGQGTPIHDHSGMWCVEGVWAGCIEVVSYEPVERDGKRIRFENVGSIVAGCGSAGSLIPPHEFHTIRNIDPTDAAVSVHIYSGAMTQCTMYNDEGDNWYRPETKQLQLDAA